MKNLPRSFRERDLQRGIYGGGEGQEWFPRGFAR